MTDANTATVAATEVAPAPAQGGGEEARSLWSDAWRQLRRNPLFWISAALILIVVTGAFAFSEIVMMKYIAFGMIAALIIDATVIRMLLVPAVMQMLGTDNWWAPGWMKRVQERIGASRRHRLRPRLVPIHMPPPRAGSRLRT